MKKNELHKSTKRAELFKAALEDAKQVYLHLSPNSPRATSCPFPRWSKNEDDLRAIAHEFDRIEWKRLGDFGGNLRATEWSAWIGGDRWEWRAKSSSELRRIIERKALEQVSRIPAPTTSPLKRNRL